MSRSIQHRGIIESINGNSIRVIVSQQSACDGCHAKGICSDKGKERAIDIETPNANDFSVNERVIVSLANKSMAFSSVVWGYVLPLIVLLIALFTFTSCGIDDGISAILSISAIAIYYIGLYLFRNKIKQKIQFTIIKE